MNSDILKPGENMEELLTGVRKAMPLLSEKQIRRLCSVVSPRAERAFRQLDPIPVAQGWAAATADPGFSMRYGSSAEGSGYRKNQNPAHAGFL